MENPKLVPNVDSNSETANTVITPPMTLPQEIFFRRYPFFCHFHSKTPFKLFDYEEMPQSLTSIEVFNLLSG